MDIQRLRNLTTGRLHTEMQHIYEDIEYLVGEKGIMTHMIPRANEALKPYLEAVVVERRFWDGAYDITHTGNRAIAPMDEASKAEFWKRYAALPSPLARFLK